MLFRPDAARQDFLHDVRNSVEDLLSNLMRTVEKIFAPADESLRFLFDGMKFPVHAWLAVLPLSFGGILSYGSPGEPLPALLPKRV
jgi:hypothetical protein